MRSQMFHRLMARIEGGSYEPDPGDSIRLHKNDDTGRVSHKVRGVYIDDDGRRWIDIPRGFKHGDEVYLLQTKAMSKRYPRVLPRDIGKYRQQPGAEVLPVLDLTPIQKNELSYFPAGVYIQVSTVEDVFAALPFHPVRVVLELTNEVREDLLNHKTTLPFSKKQIIISLDPYCPASKEDELSQTLDQLVADGFKTFVVNNVAHIAMLRGKGANVIAGPYLYTFNRWAVSWLENQNIGAFITPLENSWDNIKATYEMNVRDRVMVTVYAYPALFRMRFKLPESYDFMYFKDKEEMIFKISTTSDGTVVMPENPFSVTDKVSMLNTDGFNRILIDFSKTKLTRQEMKGITTSMLKKQPVPETSRFNWRDGFYNPERIEEYKAMNERASERKSQERYGGYGKNRGSYNSDGYGRGGNKRGKASGGRGRSPRSSKKR